jgi:hypothetical protein
MDERHEQEDEFFEDHQARLLAISKAFRWNQPGCEFHEWGVHLLPDGYQCPEDETYAELSNARDAWEEELRQAQQDEP